VQVHDYSIRAASPDDLDADIIDPAAAYLASPRHTLLVALASHDGAVVATAAFDSRGPAHPPNPRHLAERYPSGETAQLRRVYVRPEHRRRGLARRLVDELLAFAAADGGYRAVYLHTDPTVPGAEDFWRSLGKVVHDEREDPDGGNGVVHFEIPMER
jgi:GNAT superfamily N-acetyltransferase